MSDAVTMVRRSTRHTLRNPSALIMTIALPVVLLLLFVGVFGDALSAGFALHGGGYVNYVMAGILLQTIGYGATTTAFSVNEDMTAGIIARFRVMAISRTAVLTGHVLTSTARTLISAVLVTGVGLALGFRPHATPLGWLGAAGLLVLMTLAFTWLAVAVGLVAKSSSGVAPFTFATQLLPFLSSAFVPPDAMSGAVRWFTQHEPYTPMIDTLRGLLLGTAVPHWGAAAIAWSVGLGLAGYLWAWRLFKRDPRT